MSVATLPPVYKALKPTLARAEELDRDTSSSDSKVVAYYCRQYAMEQGLEIRQSDTTGQATNDFLVELMTQLETSKTSLPPGTTKEMGKATVTTFALGVFTKADEEDRAGFADKGTARGFYASALFFDILKQFGEFDPEVNEKRLYAKRKSADILKAIKEGREPTPGGFVGGGGPAASDGQPPPVGGVGGGVGGGVPEAPPAASPPPPPAAAAPMPGGGGEYSPPPLAPTAPPAPAFPVAPPAPPAPGGLGAALGGNLGGSGSGPAAPSAFNPGFTPAPPSDGLTHPAAVPSGAASTFVPQASSSAQTPGITADPTKLADAAEFTHYALRFLDTHDAPRAVQYLEQALMQLKTAR